MNARTRWSVGLQWGSSAWLVYIVCCTLTAALAPLLRSAFPSFHPLLRPSAFAWLMALVWLLALATVLSGSKWSRGVVAAAICTQLVVGTTEAAGYGGALDLPFALRFFGPMSLPLLPLVVLPAVEPRTVLALLAGGRVGDAIDRIGGFRTGLVAAALISLNRAAYDLLVALPQGAGAEALKALMLPALLVGLAAFAVRESPRRQQTAATL